MHSAAYHNLQISATATCRCSFGQLSRAEFRHNVALESDKRQVKIDKKNERKKYMEKKRSGLEMRTDVNVIPVLQFALL